jgi:hypothetical protein
MKGFTGISFSKTYILQIFVSICMDAKFGISTQGDIRVVKEMSGSSQRKRWCQFQLQAPLPR